MQSMEYKEILKKVEKLRKRISKVRIGLPNKVVFTYDIGTVTAFPKERKWVIESNGKKYIHIMDKDERNDVTKYKARLYLNKLLSGIWKANHKI